MLHFNYKIVLILLVGWLAFSCESEDFNNLKGNTALEVSESALSFTSDISSQTFDITTNKDWSIVGSNEWCKVDQFNGTGNATIKISLSQNPNYDSRSVNLVVIADEKSNSIVITQEQYDTIIFSSKIHKITEDDSLLVIKHQHNIDYTITIPDTTTWITIPKSTAKGLSEGSISLHIASNSGYKQRSGVALIANSDKVTIDTIYINQEGTPSFYQIGMIFRGIDYIQPEEIDKLPIAAKDKFHVADYLSNWMIQNGFIMTGNLGNPVIIEGDDVAYNDAMAVRIYQNLLVDLNAKDLNQIIVDAQNETGEDKLTLTTSGSITFDYAMYKGSSVTLMPSCTIAKTVNY